MQPNHTQGPLYYDDDHFEVRAENNDYMLATINDGGHPDLELLDDEERHTIGRLFAAAPELLATLTRILAAYSDEDEGISDVLNEIEAPETLAAIAKATGIA